MEPRLFGQAQRALFGVLHEPRDAMRTSHAVLLCHAGAHEYMRTHWAMRRLADTLADSGFSAMRFDYFGTGDSAGSPGEATIEGWVNDVRTAYEELREASGCKQISVVGLRLGAMLAAIAVQGLPVERLVLWDPVVDGDEYLAELRTIELYKRSWSLLPPDPTPNTLLGIEWSPTLDHSISALRLEDYPVSSKQLIVLTTQASQEVDAYVQATQARVPAQRQHVPRAEGQDHSGVMLAGPALAAIRQALGAA